MTNSIKQSRREQMKWMRSVIVLFALLLSSEGMAAAIGMLESTARIGYAAGVSRMTIDDPDGATKMAVEVQPFTLIHTDWLTRGLRYWVEGYRARATLDASDSDIGQEVNRTGLRLALQHNVRWGERSVWLGVGIDAARRRYTNRYTIDDDGFLKDPYPDRSATAVGVSAHVMSEWALASHWDLSTKLEQTVPLSDGVVETSLAVGLLYRY